MVNVRRAVFAGSWYPGTASACEEEIKGFIKGKEDVTKEPKHVGGIVPHAGWYFSGEIACNVINKLKTEAVDVFLIFGMHLHPGSDCYIMDKGAWETPFGSLSVHEDVARELTRRFNFQIETTDHFTQDNTIELQLPFIKYFFPDVKIVPIGAPPVGKSIEIAEKAVDISNNLDLKTKVLGSTDLTHYGMNYGFLQHGTGRNAVDWVRNENDRKIVDLMLAMDAKNVIQEALASKNACCAGAAAAAISAGKKLGARQAEMLYYASSFEKSPGDSFVGYTGIVF